MAEAGQQTGTGAAGAGEGSGAPVSQGHVPGLSLGEWVVFALLAGLLAAANIYTTLLIGWGDTGSIIAVLLSVVLLNVVRPDKPSVHTLNLGQTMVSAGGSIGFAVASYAAVRIIQPDFAPSEPVLIVLFAAMGLTGAIIGTTVRKSMVRYFFPSGTACAVIQRAITAPIAPGERNRPVFLLKVWGGIASVLTVPAKITFERGGHGIIHDWMIGTRGVGIGADPLYYGIGLVVGPRVGLGMLLGALSVPFVFEDMLTGTPHESAIGDWVKWSAIAVLTLPTFATIVFAYLFRQPPVVPPGFTPGATNYVPPANRIFVYGLIAIAMSVVIGWAGHEVFGMPWWVAALSIVIALPLCVVNGRVTGDTDINPVRLVAIVMLSGFFWMITDHFAEGSAEGSIAMLGMAVVGGTLASVAVDMMQDYRTGYLVDADPVHQTTVQFAGSLIGACVAIPVLGMLVGQLGIGEGSSLPAPGARVWAAMAEAMMGGFDPSEELIQTIVWVSIVGSVYAFLSVWPKTARWMPSIFGIGIGMLVGIPTSAGIFLGGLLKWAVTLGYTSGKSDDELAEAKDSAGNDTMLAGASVFAVGAILSILLVLVTKGLELADLEWFFIAH